MSEHTAENERPACTCSPARIDGYLIHRQDCARSAMRSADAESGEPGPRRAVAREVAQFNDLIPVGTPVLYWPALREGPGVPSKTRTRAWLLGDHTPVVMVEGYAGGIALSHVCPIPPGAGKP